MLAVLFLLMFASFFFIANTLGKLARQADFLLELGEVLSLAFIVIIILFSITFVYSTFLQPKIMIYGYRCLLKLMKFL